MIAQVWLDVFAMIVYYLYGWEDESWELLQVFQIKFPSERPHSGISWPYEFFFFFMHVAHVCLHGLCLHNAVFCSAGCGAQVAHDPGSTGRYMSFMSSAQFSNLGQRMIEWTRSAMTHTQWHAQVSLKNDFLDLSGNKVALWKTSIDLKFTM